jgi:hypothetical protein
MRIFNPDSADPPNSEKGGGQSLPGPTRTPELSSPIPRRQNPTPVTPPPAGSGEDNRSQGTMKFSGQGRVPAPVDLFPHPTRANKFACLCGNGSTHGRLCQRSSAQCNFVHACKPADLPPPHRATLKAFIQNHVNLSLTHPG